MFCIFFKLHFYALLMYCNYVVMFSLGFLNVANNLCCGLVLLLEGRGRIPRWGRHLLAVSGRASRGAYQKSRILSPSLRPYGNQNLPIRYKGAMRQRNLNCQSKTRSEEGIINIQRNHLEKLKGRSCIRYFPTDTTNNFMLL